MVELRPFIEALRQSLTQAASAGTEEARRTAETLTQAVEPSIRLILLESLSAAAEELSGVLGDVTVEVRLRGQDPEIIVTGPERADEEPADEAEPSSSRITLRVSESLKERMEAAASAEGVSVNTWLVRAARSRLDRKSRTTGRSITGYVRG